MEYSRVSLFRQYVSRFVYLITSDSKVIFGSLVKNLLLNSRFLKLHNTRVETSTLSKLSINILAPELFF